MQISKPEKTKLDYLFTDFTVIYRYASLSKRILLCSLDRNGDHVFIPGQHTMCYTKCNAGGLRACSKSIENTIFTLKIMTILWILCEIFYSKLVHLFYQRSSYTLQYIMVPKYLVFAQRQGDVMP